MSMVFNWHGAALLKQIRENVEEAMHGAAIDAAKVEQLIRQAVGASIAGRK